MADARGTFVTRIGVPRHSRPIGGVDHGSSGHCLVEVRDAAGDAILRLVWFKGHMRPAAGVRGFGRVYEPPRLSVLRRGSGLGETIHDGGGRLTGEVIRRLSNRIDGIFGAGTADAIDTRRTLVIREIDA